MPRIKSRDLDPQLRGRILELRDLRWSIGKIAQKHNLPKSTVQYTITKAIQRARNQESQPRIGRPRVITEDERDSLFEAITLTPEISYTALQAQECPNASIRSIYRLFQEMNIRK
jgi:transposase